jgi:hypothetical protein
MQGVHLALASLWVYVLCRFSPFPRLLKVLLVFGYYVFYQYAVICRSYMPGLLFLSLACTVFHAEDRRWRVGLYLALASLTSVLALLVAGALALAYAAEDRVKKTPALLLFGLGAALVCSPPAGA